ncbi:MAG: ketopantoate reductase family protein [Halodesulfurarchaeum sp.]
MHIAILGAGSLGSLFGGLLARERPVTLIGHEGEHIRVIREQGLEIADPDGDSFHVEPRATTDHAAVADADLVVLTVKSYDTERAMRDVEPHLEDAPVLSLQNGLGNEETIAEFVPSEQVIGGTTSHGALLEKPGLVRHTGTGDTTIGAYGTIDEEETTSTPHGLSDVAAVFQEAGIETEVVTDVSRAIWEKVLVNVGINAATALARVQNGRMWDTGPGSRLLEAAVGEALEVARAAGIEFGTGTDPIELARTVARRTQTNRSSMLQDVEADRRTEIEALNGAIVRRGEAHGIDVPVNRTLADCVRLAESTDGG